MPPETNKPNNEDRVLTLLHLLGPATSDQVLERLDAAVGAQLKNRLRNFAPELPSARRQEQILDEFERFFRFTQGSTRPDLKLHRGGGANEEESEKPVAEEYRATGDPLVDLEKMNRHQVAAALAEEQPRTVALLLRVLSPRRVADLLGQLPDAHREAVMREMSRNPQAPEIILRKIATATVERAQVFPAEPKPTFDPVRRMIDVLRETDKPQRRKMLASLEEQNPEQAALINQSLYQFDDLKLLEDGQVQKVLARVDSGTLAKALFGADETIVEKIMNNLSKRARTSLQEEIGFQRNVPAVQLKASRELVVRAIAEAESEAE